MILPTPDELPPDQPGLTCLTDRERDERQALPDAEASTSGS